MNPRLQDFNKFRDVELIQPERTQYILPAFALAAPVWDGASIILCEFPIGNTYYFSFKLPIAVFGSNFVPAIRWLNSTGDVCYRYKLFDHDDALLYYPVYAGEAIGLNAVIEIWSVNSVSPVILAADKYLQISLLAFPPNQLCSPCCQSPSSLVLLGISAASIITPYAYCNPFDVPLTVP